MSIDDQAMRYYDEGKNDELLELARREWPAQSGAVLPAGIADACFFSRNAARRKGDLVQQELWHARALTAAILTDSERTAARLLLRCCFVLLEEEAYQEARDVLGLMLRLVDRDDEQYPLFMRLFHEKSAYSFFAEGRFEDAEKYYQEALAYCQEDPRGILKVRGGTVLTGYLSHCRQPAGAADRFIAAMNEILAEAESAGFADVAEAAACNVHMMESSNCIDWCAFELV